MKKPIKRVPTDIIDELSIYCFLLKQHRLKQFEIAEIIGKDRTVVAYHLKRYDSLSRFNKDFREKIKNFNEKRFLKEYRKTGALSPFYDGILSGEGNTEEVRSLMQIVSKFNKNQMQMVIDYCQVIAS